MHIQSEKMNNIAKLAIGMLCILLLYFIYGVEETITWIKYAVLGSLLSLFFFSPTYDLIFGKFTKEDAIMLIIGSFYIVFYLIITHSTAKQFIIDFIQSIVMVAVISTGVDWIRKFVNEKVNGVNCNE